MDPEPDTPGDVESRPAGLPAPAFTGEGIADLAGLMRASQDQLERARRNMEVQFELLQAQGRALEARDLRIAELEEALGSRGGAGGGRPEGNSAVGEATRRLKEKELELLRLREEITRASADAAGDERTGVYLAARLWQHFDKTPADLWFGPRLREATAMRDRGESQLAESELEFLRASEIFDEYTRVRLQEAAVAAHRRPPGRVLNLVLAGLVALVILEQIGIIIYLTS